MLCTQYAQPPKSISPKRGLYAFRVRVLSYLMIDEEKTMGIFQNLKTLLKKRKGMLALLSILPRNYFFPRRVSITTTIMTPTTPIPMNIKSQGSIVRPPPVVVVVEVYAVTLRFTVSETLYPSLSKTVS